MIIFDLDGTLANCDHRRWYVDPKKDPNAEFVFDKLSKNKLSGKYYFKGTESKWHPNWKGFYEACDQDTPIEPVCKLFDDLAIDNEIEIWSGRCESVREKTYTWLYNNIPFSGQTLRMRPIGSSTPDNILKEMWLKDAIERRINIDYVIDDRPKVVRMWRKNDIFVFNCLQHDGEF